MTTIRLFPRESECIACGVPLIDPKQGIPCYEGDALPNSWTGEWAGFDACPACFEWQQQLTEPSSLALREQT